MYEISTLNIVWKLETFSITHILREIKIGERRSAKSAIFIHLEAINYDFHEFMHFYKADMFQITKIQRKWEKHQFWNLYILQN